MHSSEIDVSTDKIIDLEARSATLNPTQMAEEVMGWLIKNVENYIDNTTQYYKIDLVLDNDELPETKRAQDLYREYGATCDIVQSDVMNGPDSSKLINKKKLEELEKCRKILDKVTEKSYGEMGGSKDCLKRLFDRMSFFYEKIIPNPESKRRACEIDAELKALVEEKERAETKEEKDRIQEQIVKKIDEGVSLVKFIELDGAVNVTKFDYEGFDVDVKVRKKDSEDVMKQYTVPESFTVWLEISHKPKMKRPVAMF